VPPTPYSWFRNLIQELGEVLEIRVAYLDDSAVAAIITLQFKDVVYYKYGCSDESFNKFGATPWLFWRAIEAAKAKGATAFDLGRTEHDNVGLLRFKNHWVPEPKSLVYWQYPRASNVGFERNWQWNFAKRALPFMPDTLFKIVGKLIYRHVG
jgi:hypothetical protein